MQKLNSKDWPSVYSCKFLEAGIVSYEDSGAGIALLRKETIDKMKDSFIGKPVIIQHRSVGPENFQEHAVGYVISVHFNPEDAWFYADFLVTDDEAKRIIDEENYSVSCAYNVLDAKEGGLWHDIKYDGEIIDGSFTHLALVEAPRYEDSKISKQLPAMLVNGKIACISKNKEELEMSIFKLFKKKENDKQENVLNSYITMEDKAIPVSDLMLACLNGKKLDLTMYKAENDKQSYQAQDADIVDINGKTVSIGELKACYLMKTENAKDEIDPEDQEKEMEAKKKNEKEAEEKKAKEDEEAKNAKDEEEKQKKEAEELEAKKKNDKEAEEKEKKEKEDKENSKKEELEKKNAKEKEDAFFAELRNASHQYSEEEGSSPVPKTRAERAAEFRNKTNRQK